MSHENSCTPSVIPFCSLLAPPASFPLLLRLTRKHFQRAMEVAYVLLKRISSRLTFPLHHHFTAVLILYLQLQTLQTKKCSHLKKNLNHLYCKDLKSFLFNIYACGPPTEEMATMVQPGHTIRHVTVCELSFIRLQQQHPHLEPPMCRYWTSYGSLCYSSENLKQTLLQETVAISDDFLGAFFVLLGPDVQGDVMLKEIWIKWARNMSSFLLMVFYWDVQ